MLKNMNKQELKPILQEHNPRSQKRRTYYSKIFFSNISHNTNSTKYIEFHPKHISKTSKSKPNQINNKTSKSSNINNKTKPNHQTKIHKFQTTSPQKTPKKIIKPQILNKPQKKTRILWATFYISIFCFCFWFSK